MSRIMPRPLLGHALMDTHRSMGVVRCSFEATFKHSQAPALHVRAFELLSHEHRRSPCLLPCCGWAIRYITAELY